MPERQVRIDEIVDAALRLPADARDLYLDSACGADAELRREVESLLANASREERFLNTPIAGGFTQTMALERGSLVGKQLGVYRIDSTIDSGGQGEVYKGYDTRMACAVAIKVLPAEMASRPDLRQRFEREARAVAGLNHPNICTPHYFGNQDGVDYLVMEYLDGETLAHRLKKGALPLDQALRYAIEIAAALACAHRHGVVHRDLKPGNIILTKSGAKVLDFGLAKVATDRRVDTGDTLSMTQEGTIVGTLQYMAPEQLEAKEADARTDIWAFGAVLYEMVTGKKAFEGKSQASLIAAVMHNQPVPISTFHPVMPPLLDSLVKKCLAKDPDERWHSASDVTEALRWITPAEVPGKVRARRVWPLWAGLAAVAGMTVAAFAFWLGHAKAPELPELRNITSSGHDTSPATSPDGRTVVFSSDRDGRRRIWIKELARGSEVPITDGPTDEFPRFSPDGSMVLFSRLEDSKRSLYRVASVGGDIRKLVDRVSNSADWSPDGRQIVFLRRFPVGDTERFSIVLTGADGGSEAEIAHSDSVVLMNPRWSPDGRTIALNQILIAGANQSVFLVSVDSKQTRLLTPPPGGSLSAVSWVGADELIYAQNETVSSGGGGDRIIRHNITSGAIHKIFRSPYHSGVLDILGSGSIVFDTTSSRQTLREISLVGKGSERGRWLTRGNSQDRQPAYSPDGKWVMFSSDRSGNLDLWQVSTQTGAVRRLTDDPADDWDPAFTPDGKNIIWSSNRSGNLEIWIADTDGTGARQVTRDGMNAENPTATRDGRWIVYVTGNPAKQGLWKIHPDGSEATRLVAGRIIFPEVSPDGQYAAYNSMDGALRVVRIADGGAVPSVIPSTNKSRWMPDGRAIVFRVVDRNTLLGIFVQDFTPGKDTNFTRRRLIDSDPEMIPESFGISSDGTRMTISYEEPVSSLIVAEHLPGIEPPRRRGH